MSTTTIHVGARLRAARRRAGLRAADVAIHMGCDKSFVCRIERAASCNTSTVELMARAIGVSLPYLFRVDPDSETMTPHDPEEAGWDTDAAVRVRRCNVAVERRKHRRRNGRTPQVPAPPAPEPVVLDTTAEGGDGGRP